MNRSILATLLVLSTIAAIAPPAQAAAGSYTFTRCSDFGTACAEAEIKWNVLGCTPQAGTTDRFECTVHWEMSLGAYGTASCAWADFAPVGDVVNCILLPVGLTLPEAPPGKDVTYRDVKVGTRTVWEPLTVCIDYSTPAARCEEWRVPAQLPALSAGAALADPAEVVDSVAHTAREAVEWITPSLG